MTIITPIIPTQQTFAKVHASHELHLEAICMFAAIGFFLDQDTYWKDQIVLPPASDNSLDSKGYLLDSVPWFKWHYSPRDITFNEALDEFSDLFEAIIREQTAGKKVILPLSGGLDSRTQAAALRAIDADVHSYSYAFKNGYPETNIAKQIAKVCGFEFEAFEIGEGYLWDTIDDLVNLNGCYSDFTSPRQMAFYHQYANMGDVFSLGHWGDVLFDNMQIEELNVSQQADFILNKIVKRGGINFASILWNSWNLKGDFRTYLRFRITELLQKIPIQNTNAKLRAFKSLYWAPRWTSVNLSIFSSQKPITLPYYDQRMLDFICTIPEDYLTNRQLQIAYIKTRAPELAKITWEAQRPFNLHTFKYNNPPYNLHYRIRNKLHRTFKSVIGKPYVQRNWELQFLGKINEIPLRLHLFDSDLNKLISEDIISNYYTAFKTKDPLQSAHAINMLLVLSKFNQTQNIAKNT
jgi:asparagine synthetase B (glutamine-hydrolysing)